MAHHRHKREPNARRLVALTGSRAARSPPARPWPPLFRPSRSACSPPTPPPAPSLVADAGDAAAVLDPARYDSAPVSRSFDRAAARNFQEGVAAQQATARAVEACPRRRSGPPSTSTSGRAPSQAARQVGLLTAGKQVLVTGRVADGRAELVVDGRRAGSPPATSPTEKPDTSTAVAAAAGLSMAPCPDGSVEYRPHLRRPSTSTARCATPSRRSRRTAAGTPTASTSSGKALDIMTSDVALGNAIAAFLQAHASELHLYDILWQPAHLDAGPGLRGLAALRRPRLTDGQPHATTCTSRSTERGPPVRRPGR